MWHTKFSQRLLLIGCLFYFYPSSTVLAQITPDNSLGNESSIVTSNATVKDDVVDLISGGAIRDDNLFHSFSEFNIGKNGKVYFANPNSVSNILTRVTGNNLSQILGTLGVDGAANLFLLNPNGIVFGKNAKLDVNGSFLATTADSFVFNNGFEYSASNPTAPPLLTVNMPMGLQFGNKAEAIEVRGTGNNIRSFETIWDAIPKGLEVDSGNTLALIGGNIDLKGGNLTASQGRIELASIAEKGNISLITADNGFSLDGRENVNFKDINLTQSASIDTSGNGSGHLQLQGKNISLLDGSAIITRTLGDNNGREVKIHATDSVNIAGTNPESFSSGIVNNVEVGATGNGGNLNIDADNLHIKDGAQINSVTYGAGDGGDLSVSANDIEVLGGSLYGPSGLRTDTYATGKGGNLNIDADNLHIKDSGQIGAGTWNAGDSGNVFIRATNNIEVLGGSLYGPSGLRTDTYATGKGGNLNIDADNLHIKDGGQIGAGTWNAGNSGNVFIRATNVEVTGFKLVNGFPFGSGIYTPVSLRNPNSDGSNLTGNGGNLTIDAEQLIVRDRGVITSYTRGEGNAGNININVQKLKIDGDSAEVSTETFGKGNGGDLIVRAAESVEINGAGLVPAFGVEVQFDLVSNGLVSSVGSSAAGNGGNLVVETGNLMLTEGGTIFANTLGKGNAGDISIRANNLEVRDTVIDSFDSRSGISSTVERQGIGNGGNVDIIANNLRLIDGGSIAVDALGNGNAGNIQIKSKNIDVSGISSGETIFEIEQQKLSSQISAFSGGDFNAGSININADNLNLSDRGLISVSNLGNGNSGNLSITASTLNLDNFATLEAQVNAGDRGNINLTTDNIFLKNNSQITAIASNKATGGNISILNNENIVLLKDSQIIADAIEGNGGNINITTQGLFVFPDSSITASSQLGLDGNVEIETINSDRHLESNKLPENPIDVTKKITRGCNAVTNFAVVGNGGLPENPTQTNIGSNIWTDLRLQATPKITNIETSSRSITEERIQTEIIEAQAWKMNDRGQIELFSHRNTYNLPENSTNCS